MPLYARPDAASVGRDRRERRDGAHAANARARADMGAFVDRRQAPGARDRRRPSRGANRAAAPSDRVLFCLDGVHGLGVEPETPGELGVDFLVSGCHKWLFGPRGTGLVWGRREAWAEVVSRRSRPSPPRPTARGSTAPSAAVPAGRSPHAGRLPLVRAPLGAARGVRVAAAARPARRRRADARARASAEGETRRCEGFALVTPRDAAVSAGLVMLSPFGATRRRSWRRCDGGGSSRPSRPTASASCGSGRRSSTTRTTSTRPHARSRRRLSVGGVGGLPPTTYAGRGSAPTRPGGCTAR